eukprot:5075892-Amphidinium_carterae.1
MGQPPEIVAQRLYQSSEWVRFPTQGRSPRFGQTPPPQHAREEHHASHGAKFSSDPRQRSAVCGLPGGEDGRG